MWQEVKTLDENKTHHESRSLMIFYANLGSTLFYDIGANKDPFQYF